ncbi:MAG: 30S ribosomal protein S6 [Candidatus Shapirobacteria bacterium]|jgi:ribosomal protein S6|nr:30S ribosomal protein S6 [Candidatus Shapirobacteria bacterium]
MKESNYKYEVIVVLNPKAESKEKEKSIKQIEDKILGLDFKVENREDMGSKVLSYKIKDQEKGDFWVFTIGGNKPIKSKEFKLFLNRETNIIRYLILKI